MYCADTAQPCHLLVALRSKSQVGVRTPRARPERAPDGLASGAEPSL